MIGLAVSSEHVRQAHLLDLEVVVARIGAEIVGQIGFTGAGCADDDDIGVMLDILVAF